MATNFKFYQHDADIYYTNKYYSKVKSIRESISKLGIPSNKVPKLFQIITDFDRTLTHPLSYQCHGLIAQFTEIEKFKDAVQQLFSFKELFPNEPPQKWWIRYHQEMINHSFQYNMIQKLISIPDRVYMRDHTKQFFHYCLDKEIPILIVSAGVSNLIQAILKKYELILPNVHLFANRIHWKICDKSPSMDTQETKSEQEVSDHYNEKGFYDENIEVPAECMISHFGPNITSYNKEDTYKILKDEYFDREEILSRKFVIFMGDARTDPHTMKEVKGIEECIFIGFILPHRMKELDVFMECYDVVIATKNASLEFVNDILHAFLNGDHIMTESELKEEEEEFEDDEIDKDKVSELQKIRAKNHPKTFTYSFTNLRPENYQSDDQQFVQRTTNNNLKG